MRGWCARAAGGVGGKLYVLERSLVILKEVDFIYLFISFLLGGVYVLCSFSRRCPLLRSCLGADTASFPQSALVLGEFLALIYIP